MMTEGSGPGGRCGEARVPRRVRFPISVRRSEKKKPTMMRLSRTALLAALALVAGARAAGAQTIPSPYQHIDPAQSIGITLGYLLTDADVSLTDSTSAEMGHRSAPVVGLRYQVRASGPLSVDASVSASHGERKLFAPDFNADSTAVVAEDLGINVPSTVVMADVGLRFHLTGSRTWNGLAPFVAGNGGIVADIQGTLEEETTAELGATEVFRFGPSFAVGAALGTDWFPRQNASLRLELQGRLWRLHTPTGFLLDRTTEPSEWNPVLGITVGGAIHF
jgi:hypothetical protein